MVEEVHPHTLEEFELFFPCRQETHIQMGCGHIHCLRLRRIERGQGLGDILDGIRVFKPRAEHDHPVREGFLIVDFLPPAVEEAQRVAGADCCGNRKY